MTLWATSVVVTESLEDPSETLEDPNETLGDPGDTLGTSTVVMKRLEVPQ